MPPPSPSTLLACSAVAAVGVGGLGVLVARELAACRRELAELKLRDQMRQSGAAPAASRAEPPAGPRPEEPGVLADAELPAQSEVEAASLARQADCEQPARLDAEAVSPVRWADASGPAKRPSRGKRGVPAVEQATPINQAAQLQGRAKARPRTRVPIAAADRVQARRPAVRALRPSADPREDPAVLVRCDPAADSGSSGSVNCVLILPGGNYDGCSLGLPVRVALWLAELGLVAFVLRYRLRSEGHFWPAQEEDCQEALRLIREGACMGAARPGKVGVLGFSAGGHLASWAATTFEGALRPDFHALIYATTDVETPSWDPWKARFGYPGRETNTVPRVSRGTPPLFAAVSTEDDITSYEENTAPYVAACKSAGVPTKLVLANMGKHGHPMVDAWTRPCEKWLRDGGWIAA